MSKATFYGFSAWVGSITGLTTCNWWATDPAASGFTGPLIPLDLAMNTSAVRAKQITLAQLQVDDHRIDGGLTTIGPRWPSGSTIGACWLASTYYDSLAAAIKPVRVAGDGNSTYEFTSFQYFDGEQGNRRFYGFYASVTAVSAAQPSVTQVQIWNPGSSHQGTPAGTWWLDLAQVADASGTTIGPVGSSGAVFLDSATAQSLKLFGPKQPPFMGTSTFPDDPL